jgi:hypothetical protein
MYGKKSNFADAAGTFVTGVEAGFKQKIEFSTSDVISGTRWKAHNDYINWVSYVPELECVASCSFDCNVYLWNLDC